MRLPLRAGAASVAAVLVLVLGGCGSGGSGSATDTGSAGGPKSSGAGPASIPSQQLPAPAESSGPGPAGSSGSAPADTQSNAASASSGSAPAESSEPAPSASSGPGSAESSGPAAGSQDSGDGLAIADLDYDWTGEPVSGPSTALPDGEYRCYVSNAPADASLTWIGNLEASGGDLELNGNPGSIEYTGTTDVHISGAGMDSALRTVVVQEGDGTIALWVRFAEQTARCAP